MLRMTVLGAAGALALAAMSFGAVAAPLAPADQSDATATPSIVQQVHDCHRDVELGARGWHYHRRYNCERIAVPPPRREYREREHRRAPPPPICREECQYIGPFKTCKEVCRPR